jgi:hypothetical protein
MSCIVVSREAHAQASLGLDDRRGRYVGQDDVITADIERLAGPEQLVRELGLQKLPPDAACAVQHHDGDRDLAARSRRGCAERCDMHAQLRQPLARTEGEID